jgi:hypothetical protein
MPIPFTPYPFVPKQNVQGERNAAFTGDMQTAIQSLLAYGTQKSAADVARQQKILEFAKATDEGGQEFVDRFKSLGGQVPGATPAEGGGFWQNLLHGRPSATAANNAPMTMTSSALAPNQALPRTPTSAPTFTPTEREDNVLQSLPAEHPLIASATAPPPQPTQSMANQPMFPIPASPAPAPMAAAMPAPAMASPGGPSAMLPAPAAASSGGLPPITKATDITPDYLDQVKKLKGSKGLKEFMDTKKFSMEQGKDQNAMDQNTPASLAEAQAMLSPYGDQGQKAFEHLKAAYPDGKIQKSILNGTAASLAGSARQDFYGNTTDIKEAQLRQSMMKDARDAINPAFQSGPGKDQVSRLYSIGRIEPIIQQMLGQAHGGNPQQMRELATAFNKVLVGSGMGAEGQIDALVPQTARGKFANWQEFLTNNPQGTEQQAFIHQIFDSTQREKKAITSQVQQQAESVAPTLRNIKERYPGDYHAVLDSVLKNPQYTPASNAQPGAVTPQPQVSSAQEWLAQNPNSPKAAAVRQRLQQLQAVR